ncbi:MAG TPA: GNAT family N-acetyltransferase [Gemmataceae bacterium]|nr:GNAT family N-acetyltransferase [Gemmataceae bacterium]
MIETERPILREFTLDDAAAFYPLVTDPAVTRYTGDAGLVRTLEEARNSLRDRPIADYRKHGFGRLACVLKSTGQIIGFAGLKFLDDLNEVDIGYRFVPEHWGKGLATEACQPLMRYGFDVLKLDRIIGLVEPEHIASVRVLEKLGLRYAGMIEIRSSAVARYVLTAPSR